MNLLFIQGGSRVRECSNGCFYVDGNFNNNVWSRYKSYCDSLTVILRKENKIYEEKYLKDKFNKIDTTNLKLELVSDVYCPKTNYLKINIKRKIKLVIKEAVKKSDFVIIRSIGNFYTNTALNYCKKYNKKYLIEVTGFAFDGLWYHSFIGKLIAIPRELYLKKSLKKAPFAVYVTEEALQKRYPCFGKTLGCSDVEINENNVVNITKKLINKNKIILGTAAFLDVKWKGHVNVFKAISILKNKGYNNIEYHLIGSGDKKYLEKMAKKFNVEGNVKILGSLKHNDVFNWLKEIDIYIQPSYQEGLCRAIIEAMSEGCPVICSNVGGNYELINNEFIYNKKKYKVLAEKIITLINCESILQEEIKRNYLSSKKYLSSVLDKKRDEFYKKVINGGLND